LEGRGKKKLEVFDEARERSTTAKVKVRHNESESWTLSKRYDNVLGRRRQPRGRVHNQVPREGESTSAAVEGRAYKIEKIEVRKNRSAQQGGGRCLTFEEIKVAPRTGIGRK